MVFPLCAGLARRSDWSKSIELLEAMRLGALEVDVIHCNTALAALPWPLALSFLCAMVSVDAVSYGTTLACCARAGQWPWAVELLKRMGQRDSDAGGLGV